MFVGFSFIYYFSKIKVGLKGNINHLLNFYVVILILPTYDNNKKPRKLSIFFKIQFRNSSHPPIKNIRSHCLLLFYFYSVFVRFSFIQSPLLLLKFQLFSLVFSSLINNLQFYEFSSFPSTFIDLSLVMVLLSFTYRFLGVVHYNSTAIDVM